MPAAVYPARAGMRGIIPRKLRVSVLTAASGGKGLELASKHSVDVVILDYFMPETNGQEVAIEMKRLRPQAPIIMLSGVVGIPEQALRWVDAFIAKDCLASHFVRRVPTVVRIRSNISACVRRIPAEESFIKTVLLAGLNLSGKRLNQSQRVCNNSPITNNKNTSKGEIECQIKRRRSPFLRSRNR